MTREISREAAQVAIAVVGALTLMAIIIALIVAALSPMAYAADGRPWKNWGAAPYAKTQVEACRKASLAIDGFTMPPEVKEHFKQALGSSCESGTKVWLTPGMQLEQMWSGPDVRHKKAYLMNQKPVAELPVLKSPDSRPYRKGAVAETAKALSWSWTYEGKTYMLYLPFVCFNWSWSLGPFIPPVVSVPFKPITGVCPDVYTLKVNVWNHSALTLPGVERTQAEEELEERFAGTPHVSRTHGGQFRRAYAAGELKRSAVSHIFQVSLIMTPEATGGAPTITSEKIIGDVSVIGLRELQFTRKQLETWDAIRLVPITDGGIVSPPRYHITGLHELRFFNHLPGTKLGEWDANPVPDCIMNEHWIEQ